MDREAVYLNEAPPITRQNREYLTSSELARFLVLLRLERRRLNAGRRERGEDEGFAPMSEAQGGGHMPQPALPESLGRLSESQLC